MIKNIKNAAIGGYDLGRDVTFGRNVVGMTKRSKSAMRGS